jgi:hypothetical protein
MPTPSELFDQAHKLTTTPPARVRALSEEKRDEALQAKFLIGFGAVMERTNRFTGTVACELEKKLNA